MTLSFKYKTINRPDGISVKTPSIPVVLKWNEQFSTVALIDSGADITAMPLSIAQIIGCDLSGEHTSAFGIGGKVDALETKAKILVEKGHEHYEFQIPIKVILGNFDFPVLLGRVGFFDKFVISFNQSQERVSLKYLSQE